MRYLLDTTLLIDHASGQPARGRARARACSASRMTCYVCDAVVAEALSKGRDDEIAAIAALIDALEYVATHPDAAALGRRIAAAARPVESTTARRRASSPGSPGLNDAIVVTRNPRRLRGPGRPRPRATADGAPGIQPA